MAPIVTLAVAMRRSAIDVRVPCRLVEHHHRLRVVLSLAREQERFVDDLLSHMTLEEKLGQLDLVHDPDDPDLEDAIIAGKIGGLLGPASPARIQNLATQHSRLGIPLLIVGPSMKPRLSPWALAAAWDPVLAFEAGAGVAKEASREGFNCVLGPAIQNHDGEALRSPHLATSEPQLAARLASAFANGMAGTEEGRRNPVLAVCSCSRSPGPQDSSWSLNLLGDGSVPAIDCAALDHATAQRAGYAGLLWAECQRLIDVVDEFHTSATPQTRTDGVKRAFAAGRLSESEVESAARGVIAAKHRLGLFREPQRHVPSSATEETARGTGEGVRATMVLLRNEAGLLPLSPISDRVLLVGSGEETAGACAGALNRAGIGFAMAPGLAQRRDGEPWDQPVAADGFALSLTIDAARRADFTLVVLDDRHFCTAGPGRWRTPTAVTLTLLKGLVSAGTRMVALVATDAPVDLGDADQHFAAVLHCWQPVDGFDEALSDILSGRSGPQGRMPATAGRYLVGHGLGFGETTFTGLHLNLDADRVTAAITVRNSGAFAMRETVQVYARAPNGEQRLIAFDTIALQPSEERLVEVAFDAKALMSPVLDKLANALIGVHDIGVGRSSGRLLTTRLEISPALARSIMLGDGSVLRLASG